MVKQWIRKVLQEPTQWLRNSIYLIESTTPNKVVLKVTDKNGNPSELKVKGTLVGLYNSEASLPLTGDPNDMVGVLDGQEVLLYIYNGTDWIPAQNLKEYIDNLLKWGSKEF